MCKDLGDEPKSTQTREERSLQLWKSNLNLCQLTEQMLFPSDPPQLPLSQIQPEPKDLDPKCTRTVGLMVTFLVSRTGTESDQAADDPWPSLAGLSTRSSLEPEREGNQLWNTEEDFKASVRLERLNLSPEQGAWDLEQISGISMTGQGLYMATLLRQKRGHSQAPVSRQVSNALDF